MQKIIFSLTLAIVLIAVGCSKDEAIECNSDPEIVDLPINDTTYLDTLTQYFDRSADFVYHTANFTSEPNLYRKYFYGTNELYTDIAQHFDYPTAVNEGYNVSNVELIGFRIRMSSATQSVGAWDSLTYNIYSSNSSYYPEGDALFTGKFLPNSSNSIDVLLSEDDLSGVHLHDTDGFLIDFESYSEGSDIFVMSNSWCVVPNAPNDGHAERRTKVKLTSNGEWDDIITQGPSFNQDADEDQLMLDCDAYVFPFLRITEEEEL